MIINYYACSQNIFTLANVKAPFPCALCSKEVGTCAGAYSFSTLIFPFPRAPALSCLYIPFMKLSLNSPHSPHQVSVRAVCNLS